MGGEGVRGLAAASVGGRRSGDAWRFILYLMDIEEANIRMRKLPHWEQMEAVRNEVLEYFPDQ
jgi:hypothetical protein